MFSFLNYVNLFKRYRNILSTYSLGSYFTGKGVFQPNNVDMNSGGGRLLGKWVLLWQVNFTGRQGAIDKGMILWLGCPGRKCP